MLYRLCVSVWILLATAVPGFCAETWTLIATAPIDSAAGAASADTTSGKGKVKAIRLVARGGDIVLTKVTIIYMGGGKHEEARPITLRSGERTRSIDAVTQERFVDRIDFEYQRSSAHGTRLEIWGLQTPAGGSARRSDDTRLTELDFKDMAAIPVTLAAASVPLDAPHTVLLRDQKLAGDYKRLRVAVQDTVVDIRFLRLVFESGQSIDLPVGKELKPGERSDWLDVRSRDPIAEMHVGYNAARGDGSRAQIEIIGDLDAPAVHLASKPAPDGSVPGGGSSVRIERDCVDADACTPVRLFFGTNRKRDPKAGRVGFGPDRANEPTLGSATVTVPKHHHSIGKVERPAYWRYTDWYRYLTGKDEDPTTYFMIPRESIRIYKQEDQFVAALKSAGATDPGKFKDHALIYIHGFNTEFDAALYQLAQLAYDLGYDDDNGNRVPFGQPLLFSWPARGGEFGVKDYMTDTDSARLSEEHFRKFLDLVVAQSSFSHVHIIAHSMGNQVLLHVLNKIIESGYAGIRFNQIILAAPDVDLDQFNAIADVMAKLQKDIEAKKAPPFMDGVTLYASANDKALKFSTNDVHSGIPRVGYVAGGRPVVVTGVETIDISALSSALFSWNHRTYAQDMAVLEDIGRLVQSGKHPPDERTAIIQRRPLETPPDQPKKEYWYYPKKKK